MAYQALYRKYRPTSFDEVVGQRAIIQTLKNAIVKDRIAHAYLFCGPRGTGKTTVAKIFAKMLNCEDKENAPCQVCSNCKMTNEGSHPDIIEIDAASNNGVDEVRNLIERVKYAPMEGKYKVYIIDEVHMMTTGAFNALLKTIEEPPKHVIFIFATTEPHKVLPTIISRCQRFDFGKVADKDIVYRLTQVCQAEGLQVDQEALSLIAQLSDGGMRDSLSILDQCIAFGNDHLSVEDVRQIYGVLTTGDIGKLFLDLYEKRIEDMISKIQSYNDMGMDLKRITSDFISLLKESLLMDHSMNTSLVSEVHKKVISEYILKSSPLFRVNLMENLMDTFNKYMYASNVLDYFEACLLKSVVSFEENPKLENVQISYEPASEQSEKIEKKVEKPQKIEKIDQKNISDVSRETLKQSEKRDLKIILNDEYVLQLMVGANKHERQEDTQKFSKKDQYMMDFKWAKYAASLRNVNIIASGENYILLSVNSDLEAKTINEMELELGYEEFLEMLLGKPKKVFAMDMVQCKRTLELFKQCMVNHTLPEAAEVTLKTRHSKQEEELSTIEQVQAIFPDVEIVEE